MSWSRQLARMAFAAAVALGAPSAAAEPSPGPSGPSPSAPTAEPSGCPSIGSRDGTPVNGPTALRLGDGVARSIDVADDGRGDAGDVTISFHIWTDATGTPSAEPAVPTLRWSIDGGDWQPVTLAAADPQGHDQQWASEPAPAPVIRPRAYRMLRVWVAFHPPSAPGDFTVDITFDSPTCGRVGAGRDVTFAYDPRGLSHPTEVTPKPPASRPTHATASPATSTSTSPSPSPEPGAPSPAPSATRPSGSSPRAAGLGRSPLVFRAAGTTVALTLAVAGLVQWRRARSESRSDE